MVVGGSGFPGEVGAAERLVAGGVQVLHATGINNHDDVLTQLKDAGVTDGYVAVPYVDDMPSAYAEQGYDNTTVAAAWSCRRSSARSG